MEQLFRSGAIVDLIVIFMFVEALLLWLHARYSGQGLPVRRLLKLLVPGLLLLLALRTALVAGSWQIIAGLLLAALCAHLVDLADRLKQDRQ